MMSDKLPEPMRRALELAAQAADLGEIPVGCVIVDASGTVIAEAHNQTRLAPDPTAHAEMLAIRAATALHGERLCEFDLYVTLEPCTMCTAAISFARLRRVYFGAASPKTGAIVHGVRFYSHPTCHHRPQVLGGIGAPQSEGLLKDFFASRRI